MNPEKYSPEHFNWSYSDGIATICLDRPDRKNPLTFESYAELRDCFRDLVYCKDVKVIIFAPNGGNFSSGGDVHDIIGPLVNMEMTELLDFTRMTGDLVKAIRACPATFALAPLNARPPSCSIKWGWRAAIWGPVPFCRGLSVRAGHRSFYFLVAACQVKKVKNGAISIAWQRPTI